MIATSGFMRVKYPMTILSERHFFQIFSGPSYDVAPIEFEDGEEAPDRFTVIGDQSDFAPLIQFDLTQALAAEEDLFPVSDNRLRMEADERHFFDFHAFDS